MAVRDLIPWGRSRSSVPAAGEGNEFHPFLTLHREMNRLFDDVFNRFDTGTPSVFGRMSWPSLEVNTTENEVRVSAELPGLEEKDVEVTVDGDVLTIRGEKRSETEDKGRRFSECFYGRFERSLALPFEVEEDKARAAFNKGVLTVTLPKSARAAERSKRIPISGGDATKH